MGYCNMPNTADFGNPCVCIMNLYIKKSKLKRMSEPTNHDENYLRLRAFLHGGLGPQTVKFGGSPRLSYTHDQIKMRDYMDWPVTPPKRVTSPTWGPPLHSFAVTW